MSKILNISSVDGRYHSKTKELSNYLSEYALIYYRYFVEIEWIKALSNEDVIEEVPKFSNSALEFLTNLQNNFDEEKATKIKDIESETNHDVKAVEYQLKKDFLGNKELAEYVEFIHFACTSEDINNTAYALMVKNSKQKIIIPNIKQIIEKLTKLSSNYKEISMLSRTHGQTATPTTVGKEFANFEARLSKYLTKLNQIEIMAKINGAVGNFNAHIVAYPNVDWISFSKGFIVKQLGLTYNSHTTQIEPHDYLSEFFYNLSQINTILLDLSRDIWSYISLGYFKQKLVAKEVGSSTMPHKVNPIDFENAEGNFGVSNALLIHLAEKLPISRLQRDLSDSTVLRSIGTAVGHSLIAYSSLLKGLNKIEINKTAIAKDLDNSWEVLAEPIQTVMRKYKIEGAYEILKDFSRGKDINKETTREFIKKLNIPSDAKKQLLELTPASYIGLAVLLSK